MNRSIFLLQCLEGKSSWLPLIAFYAYVITFSNILLHSNRLHLPVYSRLLGRDTLALISANILSVTLFRSTSDKSLNLSSCISDLISDSACEYRIPGCENAVLASFRLQSAIHLVSMSTVKSSKSKFFYFNPIRFLNFNLSLFFILDF